MKLEVLKCPSCGADIENQNTENCICDFCGAKISLSDSDKKKFKKNKKTRKPMTKKKIIKVVSPILILLVFGVLVFTHTICIFHSFSEATIANPQTCYHCGKTKGEPKEMVEINFPTKGIGAVLPIPKSTVGELHWDNTDTFRVDIGNISKEDFEVYISKCANIGFDVDYQKGDDYYYAHNSKGNYLTLRYTEGAVMEIQVREN